MDQFFTRNRLVDPVIICIFLLALFTPMLTWVIEKDAEFSEVEKRGLQPFPLLSEQDSITGVTHAFDGYFQDHFGFRNWLIHRYQREVSKRFDMSGVAYVVVGLDNWLFLNSQGMPEDLQGRLRFSREEEQKFWDILDKKKAWLEQRGIDYLFMVAPNKQSIYPEYHPHFYQKTGKTSRFDHLLSARPTESGVEIIDVRAELNSGKSQARLYHKTDTHWNYLGAYLAYQKLIARVNEVFPDVQSDRNFTFISNGQDEPGVDLAVMLGRRKSGIEKAPAIDSSDFTNVSRVLSIKMNAFLDLAQLQPLYTVKQKAKLRVLILHDSFFNNLKPFISESFGEVLYVWQYYDETTLEFFSREKLAALLDSYQPDLVIEETVERYLPRFLLSNDNDWSSRVH